MYIVVQLEKVEKGKVLCTKVSKNVDEVSLLINTKVVYLFL